MKREKGGNLLDFMNVELMLEHVLTVMLVTLSQRYEKKTGRSERDFTHLLLCSRVASAFLCVVWCGEPSEGPHRVQPQQERASLQEAKGKAKARAGGQRKSAAK